MTRTTLSTMLFLCFLSLTLLPQAFALKANNGNYLALLLSETTSDSEAKELFEEYNEKSCSFRYLQITSMKSGKRNGSPYVDLVCHEPSSYMSVQFTITKSVSLQKLWEEPAVKLHDAIAIQGRISGISRANNTITVYPVLVKHRDRLDAKVGKEVQSEVDYTATVYNFTAGDKAIKLTREDADLIKYKDKIIATKGKQGWTDFLITEVTKREKARRANKVTGIKAKLKTLKEDPKEAPKKK